MTVLLADDEEMFLDALAAALVRLGREVVATTTEADAVFPLVRAHRPRACVLDLRFDGEVRADLPTEVRRASPETGILLLSGMAHRAAWDLFDHRVIDSLASKSCSLEAIDHVLGEVLAGRRATAGVRRLPAQVSGREALTTRERDVLALLFAGASTVEIGEALGIGEATTRSHVQHLLEKLGVHTRVQAVSRALADGLLEAEP